MTPYPKRLIEVDLPIKKISEHARNEKNLRSGHVWNLHLWWARRPWGACRAVELASLLPDPLDPLCPDSFIDTLKDALAPLEYASSAEIDRKELQKLLLSFIADFSQWEMGSNEQYVSAAKRLISAANPQNKPIVFDSFSGNGSIPGEALRLGADSIALELNPVANIILKTLLESLPMHGTPLLQLFKEGRQFVESESKNRLSQYYPQKEGKVPIAWLWARTAICEGPGCGAVVPLITQTTISSGKQKVWIEIVGNKTTSFVDINIRNGDKIPDYLIKTGGGGAAYCPICGYTTPKSSVKRQGMEGKIGHRIYAAAVPVGNRKGKSYFNTNDEDEAAFEAAALKWQELVNKGEVTELYETFPYHDSRAFTGGLYGILKWGDMFSDRQKLSVYALSEILEDYAQILTKRNVQPEVVTDTITLLALGISNSVHYWTTVSTWLSEHVVSSFISGNGIAMRWDWCEANPLVSSYVGGLDYSFNQVEEGIKAAIKLGNRTSTVIHGDATNVPLPDDSIDMFFTDPPYYDVVPYADLSDLCYVWLKRLIGKLHRDLFLEELTPKAEQILVNPYSKNVGRGDQNPQRYQDLMTLAFSEGRRCLKPGGIGAIVFAHTDTDAWESLLTAVINAGLTVTASWPIDTERSARMRANNSAALGSSVHIIVRPRENPDGSLRIDDTGEWRDVLQELPVRIHEWMPRLAEEGVVGADAIFACLGPALEIFSRYSKVEKPSGEEVTLKEYLEHVWAAVSKEALNMIFAGANTAGFEEDARLTSMWLWTLSTGPVGNGDSDEEGSSSSSTGIFVLEYDTARKIAQGLGAHLDNLGGLVEVKGDKARLLAVEERTPYLFSKSEVKVPKPKQKKKGKQMTFAEDSGELEEEEIPQEELNVLEAGKTTLDRVHQAMLLFAGGRSEALRRFLVEDGIGKDERFWRLAQAMSALYPSGTNEKRWVDGLLARKKGLGF